MTRTRVVSINQDMNNALTNAAESRPTTVCTGAIVRLPDDSLATVVWRNDSQVRVLHEDLRAAGAPGAGPWIFFRSQVELATEAEQARYLAALPA